LNLPNFSEDFVASQTISKVELAVTHMKKFYLGERNRYSNNSIQFIKMGQRCRAVNYLLAQERRSLAVREFSELFRKFDVLASPTTPTVAPSIRSVGSYKMDDYERFLEFTQIFNLLGLPAITVPSGFIRGLPLGIQLIGPFNFDQIPIRLAIEYQKLTDWHCRMPFKYS
jgi:aspartyl-tRNA(Asn)/glutamyl-tRNA(Gln) amidotransferase subunit A